MSGSQSTSIPAPGPEGRLSGKVAIVTGASRGIGEATARELSRLGASVVLAARREDKLKAIAGDIEAAGGTALVQPTDITNAEDHKRLVAAAMDRFGRLDYAVNNAEAPGPKPFLEIEIEAFEQESRLFAPMALESANRRSKRAII